MSDNLITSRIYCDTFEGTQYHHDMEENLGAISPVRKVERTMETMPLKSIYNTPEQKELIDFFIKEG